jgi:hypothetical protein
MRSLGLAVALLVTFLSMSAAAQATSHRRSSLDPSPSRSGYLGKANPDTAQTATGNPDPYLQRYYSHSEGWSYYNLPPDSSARRSGDE